MKCHRLSIGVVLSLTLCVSSACSQPTSHAPVGPNSDASSASTTTSNSISWSSNGSTACAQYLTPEFVGQVFDKPTGESKRLSDWSCSYDTPGGSNISITLIDAGASSFDTDPNAQGATPVSGIGDKAVRTTTGIEAYKSRHGICQIDVMPPFAVKLKGDALASELGEVCNKLFALP